MPARGRKSAPEKSIRSGLALGSRSFGRSLRLIPFQRTVLVVQLVFRACRKVLNVIVEVVCGRKGLSADGGLETARQSTRNQAQRKQHHAKTIKRDSGFHGGLLPNKFVLGFPGWKSQTHSFIGHHRRNLWQIHYLPQNCSNPLILRT